jgi:hypothetical protein
MFFYQGQYKGRGSGLSIATDGEYYKLIGCCSVGICRSCRAASMAQFLQSE